MTLDNMTGITKGSWTVDSLFCKSQLITCNRVNECNGVCPFEDALKHADQTQTMNEQQIVDHDREWIIGCIKHDGFIKTDRFDKANQIILDALSADAVQGEWIWRTDIPIGDGRTSAGYICSNCGKDYWHGNVFNFCPSCGARMKGGDE